MPAELPQGTVTILFTDVEGSTGIANVRGDPSAHEILRTQRQVVRREIARHDGHEVKTMGDGFMVAFASARNGVTCAIEIQRALAEHNQRHPDRRVVLRMGLNTGEAIREEDDLFGNAVAAAERIQKKAQGGEILISEALRAVMGAAADIKLRDRGRFRLKGFNERWRLYEVVWQEDAPQPPEAPDIEQTPFVGRERERAALTGLIDAAIGGRGSLVLIAGEAGIGKTRIAREALSEARRRRMLAFAGRCYEDPGAPPYAPFVEIVEAATRLIPRDAMREALGDALADVAHLMPALWRHFPDVAPSHDLPPSHERHQIFAGVSAFLARAAAARPIVVVLDDLQWADEGATQLLVYIADAIRSLPVVIIGTFRDVARGESSPLTHAMAALHSRQLMQRIDVGPFEEDCVDAMLRGMSGRKPPPQLSAAIFAETEGNPFFIEEVYKHLAEERQLFDAAGDWLPDVQLGALTLPRGVRMVIERRLERLSKDTRRMLADAAMIGRAFTLELLEAVGHLHGDSLIDAIDEAERADLIAPAPDARFLFAHELIHRTLVDGITSAQRQRLHLRVARALEALTDGDAAARAGDLAFHYGAAGALAAPTRVILALREAGDAAMTACSPADAEQQYLAALQLVQAHAETPAAERAAVLHRLAQAQYRLGRLTASRESLVEALELYRGAGMDEQMGEVHFLMAVVATFEAQAPEALRHLAAAREHSAADGHVRGLILELEAQNLVQLRQYEPAAAAIDAALSLSRKLDDTYLTVRVTIASGYYALTTLDLRRAEQDFSRVLATAQIGMHERMASESRRALARVGLGRLDEGTESARAAEAFFRSAADPFERGMACVPLAAEAIARARFDDARRLTDAAVGDGGEQPSPWVLQSLLPAMLQSRLATETSDEVARFVDTIAATAVDKAAAAEKTPAVARLCMCLRAAARGDDADPTGGGLSASGRTADLTSLPLDVLSAETALMLGRADLAEPAFENLDALYGRGVLFTPRWVALLPRLLGARATLRRQWEDAERLLSHALEVASRTGATAELAATHLEFAELHARRGPDAAGAAASHLGQAKRLIADAGITVLDRRLAAIDELLRSPGDVHGP